MNKILVMGLPGSGKTYFADKLKAYIESNSEYFSPAFELSTSRAEVKRLMLMKYAPSTTTGISLMRAVCGSLFGCGS
jgi:GTPase SAR1 family protein